MTKIPDPPAGLHEGVGHPDQFRSCGLEFLDYFKRLTHLADGESVLDVGCGPGRMAIPIAEAFPNVRYEGFDVSKSAIDWCRAEISKVHPSFSFTWVDAKNRHYNPNGSVDPATFRFPYGDGQFDLAILVSVFTHLTPDGVGQYLSELSRVIKPKGRIFVTAFLIDEDPDPAIEEGKILIKLTSKMDGRIPFWTSNPTCPEDAIGYSPKDLIPIFYESGFSTTIYPGKWHGREGLSGHDIIVAESRAP